MKRTIVLNSEFLGRGDEELGAKLINAFLRTLLTAEVKPDTLVLYNSGVKLLAEEAPTRSLLDELNQRGVRLVACGTCVSFFKLDDRVPKEHVSNMAEIVRVLTQSESVVTL